MRSVNIYMMFLVSLVLLSRARLRKIKVQEYQDKDNLGKERGQEKKESVFLTMHLHRLLERERDFVAIGRYQQKRWKRSIKRIEMQRAKKRDRIIAPGSFVKEREKIKFRRSFEEISLGRSMRDTRLSLHSMLTLLAMDERHRKPV